MTELFFDTETTGLAHTSKPYYEDCQPRMVQFGAILSDGPRILNEVNILVVCDCDIHPMATKAHGISKETTQHFGMNEMTTAHIIRQLFSMADTAIAHNVNFDKIVVCNSLHRLLGDVAAKKIFFHNFCCTMLSTTEVVKLPQLRRPGSYKWPTLQELHKFLFAEEFSGAHDAMADVRALRRCYYELRERKLI